MASPDPSPPVSRRVDAERNRELILEAARAAFADHDADVSMAEIARRAGVGSATLYRNFADRRRLLEAIYVGEIEALCAAAATVDGDGAGANLEVWLRRFYEYFSSKRLVAAELLEHADADAPIFGTGYASVVAAGEPLVAAARKDGEVRADLDLEQILAMLVAIAKIPGDATRRAPILDAALDGLRTVEG